MTADALLLAALFFAAALLYSSVGHAGASAYLAAMALVGVPAAVMRPTALVLNLFVASIVTVRFAMAGHLPWRSLVPLAIGSVPAAFIGGSIDLPGELYRPLVAAVLVVGAWRLATAPPPVDDANRPGVPWIAGIVSGATIGLLAGLTGTGGGIFLTPLLVLAGWTGTRDAAGLSGSFILVNSIAGLAGLLTGGGARCRRRCRCGSARWRPAGSSAPGRGQPIQHPRPAARARLRAGAGRREAGVPTVTPGVGWSR